MSSLIQGSALWAAFGDALGFITETRGLAGARSTLPKAEVRSPVAWTRRVGGRYGPSVQLPAGCYSDDTQLRLATSRSIRGDGSFDVEAFAKVELPVFLSYALGAGRGTSAAAHNLARRDVTWYSNFFEGKDASYLKGGGNGAAMRIQPHVWISRPQSWTQMLTDVFRNAITTHGHARGFLGAVFHAQCLAYAMQERSIPTPKFWLEATRMFSRVSSLLAADENLERVWLPTWESRSRGSLIDALRSVEEEQRRDIDSLQLLVDSADPGSGYAEALKRLGLLRRDMVGSGTKTALIAAALCHMFRHAGVEAALVVASNRVGSDTDTIATMAGAIFGCVAGREPRDSVIDSSYFVAESQRLETISRGRESLSFKYPDLLHWRAPKSQADAVGLSNGKLAVTGLGFASPIAEPVRAAGQDGVAWQWLQLDFGQTILAKRRLKLPELPEYSLPRPQHETLGLTSADYRPRVRRVAEQPTTERSLREYVQHQPNLFEPPSTYANAEITPVGLNELTDEAIKSGFDPSVVGRNLMILIDQSDHPIEAALAFAAILAKAREARRRSRTKDLVENPPTLPARSKRRD